MFEVIQADVLEWAANYSGEPFHAIFCDPPYHLTDEQGGGGFMSLAWDRGSLAFRPETWAALARHLHPGGFVLAFASTRGFHRQAVAMEDAGLIMHPVLLWVNSQSFPKASRLDTQIDAAAGAERETVWCDRYHDGRTRQSQEKGSAAVSFGCDANGNMMEVPATDLARTWAGHRYGRQALKNCAEVLLVFQKPYQGRPIDCMVATGAGAYNIDGARIPTQGGSPSAQRRQGSDNHCRPGQREEGKWVDRSIPESYHKVRPGEAFGRWPSNFILCHLPPHECAACAGAGQVPPGEPCPACGGTGLVGGCRQVGEKQVQSSNASFVHTLEGQPIAEGYGFTRQEPGEVGYATPDGTETVPDWQCQRGPDGGVQCPMEALDGQAGPRRDPGSPCRLEEVPDDSPFGFHNRPGKPYFDGEAGGCASRFYQQSDWSLDATEWACAEGCPTAALNEQAGATSVTGRRGAASQAAEVAGTQWLPANHQSPEYPAEKGEAARYFQQADWGLDTAEWICAELGQQSGECPTSSGPVIATAPKAYSGGWAGDGEGREQVYHGDDGMAARYFEQAHWSLDVAEQLEAVPPFKYAPKTSPNEENKGLHSFVWRRQGRDLTRVRSPRAVQEYWRYVTTLRVRHGMGWRKWLQACGEKSRPLALFPYTWGNIHVALKPLAFCEYVARLVLPPPEYSPRRVLVPFVGSGSEMVGALLAGWEEVVGIEAEGSYVEIAEARLEWWTQAMAEGGPELASLLRKSDRSDGSDPTERSERPARKEKVRPPVGGQMSLF